MSAPDYDVVVAGAGMVGACAAFALASRGMQVALVEPAPAAAPVEPGSPYDLRVSAISPQSRRALTRLGAWQRLDHDRVCRYEQMHIWHENGDASIGFDAVDLARDDLGAIVENRLLQQALQAACEAEARVQWFRPDSVGELLRNDESGVELRLQSGRTISAALLLAADGRQSPTRALAGIDVEAGDYRQRAIVANVDTSEPHRYTAWQRFLKTGPLAFLPLANGQSSIVWSCDLARADELEALDDAAFCHALAEAFEFRLGRVSAVSERRSFPLGWHRCEHWLAGRVLLIGDAAHSVHPLAGQGVNLGFSDVELLVELIGDCRERVPGRLLRRFERQRKSETWLAGSSFSALKWIYGLDQPGLARLRDLGMLAVEKTPWLKRELIGKAVRNIT